MKSFTCTVFLFLIGIVPSFAVTVNSPGNGAEVSSPFSLSANASTCSSQTVVAMGYSLDESPNNTIVNGNSVQAQVTAANGSHTLHVKAWGNGGASCVSDVGITVAPSSAADGITVSSPGNGAEVSLPFAITAKASTCSSQPVSAMGYSFDNSAANTIVNGTSIDTDILSATKGSHTLHIKAWGTGGASCVDDFSINVVAAGPTTTSVKPVSVSSPSDGSEVSSPFQLSANASTCSSQQVSAMGYSLDSSPSTTTVGGTSIDTQISAAAGAHTVHVKSWGNNGSACVTDVAINVNGGSGGGPSIPSNAVSVSSIQTLSNWLTQHDTAIPTGEASGTMSMVGSPSQSGHARKFVSQLSDYAGQRFDVAFGDDTSSSNFLYDAWVYLDSSVSQIANLELDMNQTMPNGQTAIFGFQCDGWSSTWDYTGNKGSAQNPVDTWIKSNQSCNIHNWSANTWHHVQVTYSRDSSGNVTYKSVWLDGKEQDINKTVYSAFDLGWQPVLLTNLQVDEAGSGKSSATVYLDNITVYRW